MMFDTLNTVKKCLGIAYDTVHGKDELKDVTSTSIDIATKGDEAAGLAMLAYLKKSPQIGVAYTEEGGKVLLNGGGKYSAIIDDIDGSKNYKEGFGMLPHGSIIGIFKDLDPTFEDCIGAGFLEFNSGNLIYALRSQGTYIIECWKDGQKDIKQLRTTGRKQLFTEKNLTFIPDIYMLGGLASEFTTYSERSWMGDFRCSALHISMVADGVADVFVTGDNSFNKNKHKTGEELGPGYLLVREAGREILDWTGRPLQKERVGLGEKRSWHVVVAATKQLGQELCEDIAKKPPIAKHMKQRGLML